MPTKKKAAVAKKPMPEKLNSRQMAQVLSGFMDSIIPDEIRKCTVKILQSELDKINALREQRTKARGSKQMGISLSDWIIEAINEKIYRDNNSKVIIKGNKIIKTYPDWP